jgi:hypothetical protein
LRHLLRLVASLDYLNEKLGAIHKRQRGRVAGKPKDGASPSTVPRLSVKMGDP